MTGSTYPKSVPQWVRGQIEVLKKNVAWWKEQCRSATEGDTDVGFDLYGNAHGKRQFLPEGTEVWFLVNGEPVTFRMDRGDLLVRGASGLLSVFPEASNSFRIRRYNRWDDDSRTT